jgi:hypothetical protein
MTEKNETSETTETVVENTQPIEVQKPIMVSRTMLINVLVAVLAGLVTGGGVSTLSGSNTTVLPPQLDCVTSAELQLEFANHRSNGHSGMVNEIDYKVNQSEVSAQLAAINTKLDSLLDTKQSNKNGK